MDVYILAVFLSFLTVILIFAGIISIIASKKKKLSARLEKYTGKQESHSVEDKEKKSHESSLRGSFKSLSGTVAPKGWIKTAEVELAQADIPLRPEEYVTIQMLIIVVLTFLSYFVGGNLLLTVVVALLAALTPSILLKRAKARRIMKFNNQLGEGLSIMANSLRAGFSFMQSVDTLSKEMPPPLSTEFARMLKEMNLGSTTEEALDNLLNRVESEDLDLVITAVKIQRQVGGNLAEVLERIAATIKQRIKLKGEVKTLTAQSRVSGLIIGLLPLFIIGVVSLIHPEYITTLFTHPLGFIMLGWAVVSEIIGFLVIRKIVAIDY